MHDPLTGLLRWDTLSQLPEPSSDTVLLFIGLRGFKAVNDEHTQVVGDRVLVEIARRITEVVGDVPVLRAGGDEFLVVARLPDEAAIRDLATRLRERLEEPIDAIRVGTWAVAGRAAPGDTHTALFRRADRAMMAVTQNGWSELLIAPPDADEGTWYARP